MTADRSSGHETLAPGEIHVATGWGVPRKMRQYSAHAPCIKARIVQFDMGSASGAETYEKSTWNDEESATNRLSAHPTCWQNPQVANRLERPRDGPATLGKLVENAGNWPPGLESAGDRRAPANDGERERPIRDADAPALAPYMLSGSAVIAAPRAGDKMRGYSPHAPLHQGPYRSFRYGLQGLDSTMAGHSTAEPREAMHESSSRRQESGSDLIRPDSRRRGNDASRTVFTFPGRKP